MIYITHGVVSNWNPERISHGLMLSESAFTSHLEERNTKYVPLTEALLGRGDALTVDDATYAGLHAAQLARKHGHAVSWFVNGMNVERGIPYFPFLLSWMLDETKKPNCSFDGHRWNLTYQDDRRALRLRLKYCYMKMRSCQQIAELLAAFSDCLEVAPSTLDHALATVSSDDLELAVDSGVELRNHGWTHLNPLSLSKRELEAHVQRNDRYLARFRQLTTRIFAPPFGHRVDIASSVATHVLLADRNQASDQQTGNLVNRCELHLNPCWSPVAAVERFAQTA